MWIRSFIIVIVIFFVAPFMGHAQKVLSDSAHILEGEQHVIKHEDLALEHSPKKATLMSTFLPGAGQFYNKKYWKIPVIWVGVGTAIVVSQVNRDKYHFWKDQYLRRLDPDLEDDFPSATVQSLEDIKSSYKQSMETAYIAAGVIYLLQILDANVDAQLMSFDVSDDLSLNLNPNAIPNLSNPAPTYGVTLCLKLK
tara:strand:- start:44675 stop:45262 length:588 start_codon:yes stop_codon:yes gene_type:complete